MTLPGDCPTLGGDCEHRRRDTEQCRGAQAVEPRSSLKSPRADLGIGDAMVGATRAEDSGDLPAKGAFLLPGILPALASLPFSSLSRDKGRI